jgi:transcriptional regulator
MKRRDLLAGFALAGIELEAQTTAGVVAESSLYIPKPHLVEDRKFLHDFMDEFAFVDLVTAAPEIRITHIPSLLDRTTGKYGTIRGHISRQNPQSKTFDRHQGAVIAFRGPHSYISPTWYAKTEVVPTWNFAVVHASGKLRPIAEPKAIHDLLAQLIHKFENSQGSAYDFARLPDSYTYPMIAQIIGFEMEIEVLEGKFKLGQERSEADKQGVLKGLQSARPARSIHDFTDSFYRRPV